MNERRPNILILMVDQMRLPRWFPKDAALPTYDRLRREGLLFENSFVCANPCSPSRAGIVTGLHYTQHGIHSNVAGPGTQGMASLDPRLPTFGHVFKRAGYRTPYIGKWHLTSPAQYEGVGLAPYGFEEWQGPDCEGFPLQGLREDPGFATRAVAWLEENVLRGPWILTCSFVNPHDIMFYRRTEPPDDCPRVCDRLPGNYADDLGSKPRIHAQYQKFWGRVMGMTPQEPDELWRRYGDFYYYLTRKVDAEIGRVLDALERSGAAADTLTVFLSDHGEMAGAHKLQGKGPFVYQENVQVPTIFRWPGRIRAGATTDALAHNIDLFPTLIDLAGIGASPQHLPGKSLAPVVRGDATRQVNDHVILSWGMTARRMQPGPMMPTAGRAPSIPDEVHGIFDGRYKLARYFEDGLEEEEIELYDLREDPLELANLAADPGRARIRRELAERLRVAEETEMAPIDPEQLASLALHNSSLRP